MNICFRPRQGSLPVRTDRSLPLCFVLITAVLLLLAVSIVRNDVVLEVDGKREVVTTYSNSVEQLLAELNLVVGEADLVIPGLEETIRSGMVVQLKRAFTIPVHYDEMEMEAVVASATVAEVVAKMGIELGKDDRIEPALTHLLAAGDEIRITRIERKTMTEQTELPYREIRRGNPEMDRGESRVIVAGKAGIREDTIEITLEDGKETAVKVVQSQLLVPRQDRVVEYGENAVLSRSGRSISFDRVLQMEATAYCEGTAASGCPIDEQGRSQCTGSNNDAITASGQRAIVGSGSEDDPHLVAVDPNVIDLGTTLYIEGYGFAVAADTGGAIVGHRIDLLLDTHQEALRFGRRNLRVYVLP